MSRLISISDDWYDNLCKKKNKGNELSESNTKCDINKKKINDEVTISVS